MHNSRVPQHVSIWPLTRLETAMFLLAALGRRRGYVGSKRARLLGDIGHHLEDLISPRR
jgi:hypothetical protein